ncbi:MAG: PD40 domain-containing protein, partial [Anaerolineales bacterium]|nr:PD40 domain-containing protein [Anaerolineales bacterium]
ISLIHVLSILGIILSTSCQLLPPETALSAGISANILPSFTPLERPNVTISAENADQVIALERWGTGYITELKYSPNGSRLAVKSALGITLYDAQSLAEISFLEVSTADFGAYSFLDPITSDLMSFSPDGQILAAIEMEKLHLWRAEDGAWLRTLQGEGENYLLSSIAFSPDSKLLAAAEVWSSDVNVWQVWDGKLLQSWKETPPNCLAFSPDGQILISSNGEMHRISDGTLLQTLEGVRGNLGESASLGQVALSPDGSIIAADIGPGIQFGLWQASDGQLLQTYDGWAGNLAFSPDGQILAVWGNKLRLISIADGQPLNSPNYKAAEDSRLIALAFLPDGRMLAADSSGGAISVWDPSSGQLLRQLKGHLSDIRVVKFTPDGLTLAAADARWIGLWRIADGEPLGAHRHGYPAPVLSPDGSTLVTELAVYWRGMQVWDAATGSLRYTLEDAQWPLTFSADASLLATSKKELSYPGHNTSIIQVLRATDGSLVHEFAGLEDKMDNLISDLAFSPDGTLLTAVQDSYDIVVWNLAVNEPSYKLEGDAYGHFYRLAFSPDGQILASGSEDHKVRVWRAADGRLLNTLEMKPSEALGAFGEVRQLMFSPNGELLAAADVASCYQVWRVADWATLLHDTDHINQMYDFSGDLAFSPDGKLLALGGSGNAISLWRVADGALLSTLSGHVGDITQVAFSPDGRWLYSGSLDGTVRFWGVPRP